MRANNLIWLDLEMTGLDPEVDLILEIATIVTNDHLDIIEEGPVIAINQPQAALDNMNTWCQNMHHKTGLVKRVQKSTVNTLEAEELTLSFLKKHVSQGVSPMCGNSIGQDRRFLVKYMPSLHEFFHYRNLDVSTLKELVQRWKPELMKQFTKKGTHKAFEDICDSIDELRFYRKHFIKL